MIAVTAYPDIYQQTLPRPAMTSPSDGQPPVSFQIAFERLEDLMSKDDNRAIASTTMEDVWTSARDIERQLQMRRSLRGFRRIPWAGASAVKCLGIPHQKSTYMVWPPNAPSNKQYGYIYESHIAYSYEYPLMVLVFEFFCLRNQ